MPISEYEVLQESPCGTPVKVKIHSTQHDMIGASLFGDAIMKGDSPEDILEDTEFSRSDGTYILTTEGKMEAEGNISVKYREEGLSEVGCCLTEISFAPDNAKSVTITRSGDVPCIFLIEEGKRQISIYNTPYGPLEMCTFAKRVNNKIGKDGGTLVLDYAVELRGMTAQRTKMRVDVTLKK